jgi:hypothetical protein
LTPSNYTNDLQVLHSSVDPVTATSVRRLDPTKVVGAAIFVSGNLPPNDDRYRNPERHQVDLSLSKNFPIREGKFFQIRAEAQNAFNIRGFGNYQSQIGNANYGVITSAGNTPRQIQLSGRINF